MSAEHSYLEEASLVMYYTIHSKTAIAFNVGNMSRCNEDPYMRTLRPVTRMVHSGAKCKSVATQTLLEGHERDAFPGRVMLYVYQDVCTSKRFGVKVDARTNMIYFFYSERKDSYEFHNFLRTKLEELSLDIGSAFRKTFPRYAVSATLFLYDEVGLAKTVQTFFADVVTPKSVTASGNTVATIDKLDDAFKINIRNANYIPKLLIRLHVNYMPESNVAGQICYRKEDTRTISESQPFIIYQLTDSLRNIEGARTLAIPNALWRTDDITRVLPVRATLSYTFEPAKSFAVDGLVVSFDIDDLDEEFGLI